MKRSAVILAFGNSKGFNEDKGILPVDEKPLIRRVSDAVDTLVDEVIVVASSQEKVELYEKILPSDIKFVVLDNSSLGSIYMALSGFEKAKGEYSLLLPFDSPFVSPEVIALLFDLSIGKAAVIPRSPDNEAKPLHSVYNTKQFLETAKEALNDGESEVESIPLRLHNVRYVSTMVIEQLDSDLKSFFRVITPLDLRRASVLSKPKKWKR